jgi:CheY-like chemotaxis protein
VDGFEFISRLRATTTGRQIPIIVWTVKDLRADERSQLQASSVVIISKSAGGSASLVEELRRLLPAISIAPGDAHGQ